MLEHNQWLAGAVVLDGDTLGGGRGGDEKLVLALPAEPEHGGGGAVKAAQLAVALYQNTAVGGRVGNRYRLTGLYRQLLGGDVWVAVGNPLFGVVLGLRDGEGRAEIVLAVVGIHVLVPIQKAHDVVQIPLLVLRAILGEEAVVVHFPAGDILKDRVDVGVPLGLVGQVGAGGMDDTRGGIPARAQLNPIRPG